MGLHDELVNLLETKDFDDIFCTDMCLTFTYYYQYRGNISLELLENLEEM